MQHWQIFPFYFIAGAWTASALIKSRSQLSSSPHLKLNVAGEKQMDADTTQGNSRLLSHSTFPSTAISKLYFPMLLILSFHWQDLFFRRLVGALVTLSPSFPTSLGTYTLPSLTWLWWNSPVPPWGWPLLLCASAHPLSLMTTALAMLPSLLSGHQGILLISR
jgi:hypothetical protein